MNPDIKVLTDSLIAATKEKLKTNTGAPKYFLRELGESIEIALEKLQKESK